MPGFCPPVSSLPQLELPVTTCCCVTQWALSRSAAGVTPGMSGPPSLLDGLAGKTPPGRKVEV